MLTYDAERLCFMKAAFEYTGCYGRLAAAVAPKLRPDMAVCDAGCGLGYLSEALLPYVGSLTAVDREPQAIELLRARRPGLRALCGDIFQLPPNRPYDAMVCCFFGSVEEALSLAKAQCRPAGLLILIKRRHGKRRFSLSQGPCRHAAPHADAEETLRALGVSYTLETLCLEMGQPFQSFEEALRFFALYAAQEEKNDPEAVRARLIPINEGPYRYYFPSPNTLDIFSIPMEV